jgi:hypothetical protein
MKTCEQYREAIAADPSFDGSAAHVAECASCREFQAEIQALDAKISQALSLQVPALVMPELPDVDTSKVTALPVRRIKTPVWLAMAATVALAAVIGFRMLGTELSDAPLADQILAHIDHEPYALRVTDEAVSDRRLGRVVHADLATMDGNFGLITYAQSCRINGREVPHLVIQGERGPVTILLMPYENIGGEAQEFGGESVNGVILPVGNGSIAIVGENDERLENIEQRVRNSVKWTT